MALRLDSPPGPLLDALLRVLEFLPWPELGHAVAPCCSAWCGLAKAPPLWSRKHAEHFGWEPHLAALDPAHCFRTLRLAQVAALEGEHIDMVGTWVGRGEEAGFVYHFRMSLASGPAGQALWRGTAEDAPFWLGTQRCATEEYIEELASWPPDLRSGVLGRCTVRVGCEVRGLRLDSSAIPIGGMIQWQLGKESSPETVQRCEELIGLGESLTAHRHRAVEFVSGVFVPWAGRCVVCGTHISNAGAGLIGLDLYDLDLEEDGLSLCGATCGIDGAWESDVTAMACEMLAAQGGAGLLAKDPRRTPQAEGVRDRDEVSDLDDEDLATGTAVTTAAYEPPP